MLLAKRRRPPGRPPIDDDKAVEWVRELRKKKPRLSYLQAALRWVESHPPTDCTPKSAAKRISQKARKADNVFRDRLTEQRCLRGLEESFGLMLFWLAQLRRCLGTDDSELE